MKRKTWVIFGVAGVGLAATVFGAPGDEKWQASPPTKENFEKVVRAMFEGERAKRVGGAVDAKCLPVPTYPEPDSTGKSEQAFTWRMDFIIGQTNGERQMQLRQLDALAKAGLLDKGTTVIEKDGTRMAGVSYTLSDKGWAATIDQGSLLCFPYGTPSFRGVTGFERALLNEQAGIEVYVVAGELAINKNALPAWARDPDLQQAFPDLAADLKGREFRVQLIRGGKGWVDYGSMASEEYQRKQAAQGEQNITPEIKKRNEQMNREAEELGARYAKLEPPTEEEIKQILRKQFSDGRSDEWPYACVPLPGAEKLPVDEVLHGRQPSARYAVAIYTDKERTESDPIATKTIPYAKQLSAIGVLTKRSERQFPGRDKLLHQAEIYELAPGYDDKRSTRIRECFDLGATKVDFIAIRIHTDPKFNADTLKYRVRLRYLNPPTWMLDSRLIANWRELRESVKNGMACDGDFGFDRETREMMGGGGSCWWAHEGM